MTRHINKLAIDNPGRFATQERTGPNRSIGATASFTLWLIGLAQDAGVSFEDLADGFGPGSGTHGDWSGIRDSSSHAKELMTRRAMNFLSTLAQHRTRAQVLAAIELANKVDEAVAEEASGGVGQKAYEVHVQRTINEVYTVMATDEDAARKLYEDGGLTEASASEELESEVREVKPYEKKEA